MGSVPARRRAAATLAVVVAGCALRLLLVLAAPRWAFPGDHAANLIWGAGAVDHGIARVYSLVTEDFPTFRGTYFPDLVERKTIEVPPGMVGPPNHPPITLTVYAFQAMVVRATVSPLVLNTTGTRVVTAATHTVFEALLALATGWLAAWLWGAGAGRRAAAVTWLFPPFALNASFWGQVDTLLLAPAVLCVALLVRSRWGLAGAAAAVAVLVKPQGLLLAPVVLFAAFAVAADGARPGMREVLARLGRFLLSGLLVGSVIALPWVLSSGFRWIDQCYRVNIVNAYPETTLKAFNVWFLDLLRLDSTPDLVTDSSRRLLGVSKDVWGRVLLAAALLASALLARRRCGVRGLCVVMFAALWLWSTFIWPTRVHERYIVYCMPFVIAVAVGRRRFLPALAGLLLVGVAEHTWNIWTRGVPAGSLVTAEKVQDRHRENLAAFERLGASGEARPRDQAPTQALADVRRAAADELDEYLTRRAPVRRLELAVTLTSLLAYALSLWAACALTGEGRAEAGRPVGPSHHVPAAPTAS
jgi:hypothetical protein